MASCRLLFVLLVISVIQCYASVDVPVYLWGDLPVSSGKANPLQKTSEQEFKELIDRELKDAPFTVVFLEETLSVEDLSRKDADGKTSFPYLQANVAEAYYLPSVEDALSALTSSADPEAVDEVTLTKDGLSDEIEPQSGRFLFISLQDAREGESRSELLRRHNDFMERKYTELQSKVPNVIAVFTARNPSWTVSETSSRVRRQAPTETLNHDYIFDRLRLYVERVQLQDGNNVMNLTQLTGNSTLFNETSQILNSTLNFGEHSITINFINKAGYWMLNTISLTTPNITETLYPSIEIYSLVGWSYRCAEHIRFETTVNDTNKFTLDLDNLKIQPFFNENLTSNQFGESFNCSGFFSIAIWAGLFVAFVLLAITFFGITMIMDIRTMDRFDDPKGKTITINASE